MRVPTNRGYTGVQVARRLLDQHGLQNIPIELSRGKLSDHYDPTKGILRLSQEVNYKEKSRQNLANKWFA
ncbi:MAG TPA: zinc metallopeptidase [Bacillota bacterium]|uniref:zinc metallopeptidase n=1 Tax=Xylanivirga thermophila TaxID=2496273 RepID=UPI001FB4A13A|nr:zinc metallopeptidase [Xylanivirga thermophila]HOR86323.1 zinc metallopeptidase [Bacillota bacterium]HOV28177.1 zinc metallopeptidase [Pseudobacteroides sp.]HPT66061.1 zinc metallopeptidase [Candidatus Woesebacteria bacterium]